MHGKHTGLIGAFLLLAAMVGSVAWLIYAQERQERLNRALLTAVKQNDTKTTLALLEEGANPNARDEPPNLVPHWRLLLDRLRGKRPASSTAPTALLIAVGPYLDYNKGQVHHPLDHPQLIKALLDKGANPNVSLGYGNTPLLLAARTGYYDRDSRQGEIIKLMLEHGADPNPPSDISPLMYAVMGPSPTDDVIVSLLNHGAKIDAQDHPFGQTPLMEAVWVKRVHVAQLLLSYHANPNIKDRRGETPLSFARRYASIPEERQIAKILKQAGAKK